MARNKGTFSYAANYEVKMQAALDPRVVVDTKSELILKSTWPFDGNTIYLYKGLLVGVISEQAVYMLVDIDKITSTDYSGWVKVGGQGTGGGTTSIDIVDNLTSNAPDKALSARQGKILMGEITSLEGKLTAIYTFKGTKPTYSNLPQSDNKAGDVWYAGGLSYVWTGTDWEELSLSVDLSNYYSKEEVDYKVKAEEDRAKNEEKRIEEIASEASKLADGAKTLASTNKLALEELDKSVQAVNNRVSEIEKNGTGVDPTLLQKVDDNTADIKKVSAKVDILNSSSVTVGSVDYKIAQAFRWISVPEKTK